MCRVPALFGGGTAFFALCCVVLLALLWSGAAFLQSEPDALETGAPVVVGLEQSFQHVRVIEDVGLRSRRHVLGLVC